MTALAETLPEKIERVRKMFFLYLINLGICDEGESTAWGSLNLLQKLRMD
jgi:hypothetical protein